MGEGRRIHTHTHQRQTQQEHKRKGRGKPEQQRDTQQRQWDKRQHGGEGECSTECGCTEAERRNGEADRMKRYNIEREAWTVEAEERDCIDTAREAQKEGVNAKEGIIKGRKEA